MSKQTVSIASMSFSPPSVTVKVGDCVCWTNNDDMIHTVTFDDASSCSGDISPGASYDKEFATAGTFPYHCAKHPHMKGTVVVS